MRFAQGVIRWARLEAVARIVDPVTETALPGRPLYAFRRGQAQLLGCLRGHFVGGNNPRLSDSSRATSFTDEAKFTWSGDRHVYNVRSGDYLGFGSSATIEVPSFRARLLCLLPYKVEELELDAPTEAASGRVVAVRAQVRTDGEMPGEHVFYFEVKTPAGARRPLYGKTRVAPGGRATHEIPFALNDPAGEWSVTVHDVMTGAAAVQMIRLEPSRNR